MDRKTGRKKPRMRTIVTVVVIVLLLAGLAAVYVLAIRPALDASEKNSAADNAAVRDTRSDATKSATASAGQKAADGDVDGAYSTIDTQIAATDKANIEDLSSLYQTKATIAANAGNKEAAVAAQNEAIKLEPKNYKLIEGLGEIYSYLGDTANADTAFKRADDLAKQTGADSYHGVTTPSDGTH